MITLVKKIKQKLIMKLFKHIIMQMNKTFPKIAREEYKKEIVELNVIYTELSKFLTLFGVKHPDSPVKQILENTLSSLRDRCQDLKERV